MATCKYSPQTDVVVSGRFVSSANRCFDSRAVVMNACTFVFEFTAYVDGLAPLLVEHSGTSIVVFNKLPL